MTDLTVEEIEEKIKMVKADLASMQSGSGTIKQIVVLESYKEYLEGELEQAKKNASS